MTPSDDLFLLIKSLSKSEKGHFKKYASKHVIGDQNSYIKIFDATEAQKKYDEAALKKLFKHESFLTGFAPFKIYLYNLILKSLSVFHADKSVESELARVLLNTEILFKKGLFKQAYKPLLKAKVLAYEHDRFELLLACIDWQKRLLLNGGLSTRHPDDMENITVERPQVIEKLSNVHDYEKLALACNRIVSQKETSRNTEELKKIKEILSYPLLANEKSIKSDLARHSFYNMNSFLNYEAGNTDASYNFCKKNIALMESYPGRIKDNPMKYLSALQNLQVLETKLKKYDNVLKTLQKSRGIAADHGKGIKDVEIKIFEWTYSSELLILITTGEFEKAYAVTKIVLQKLDEYGISVIKTNELFLKYYVAYLFFILKRYKESHDVVRELLNDSKLGEAEDIISFALILNLLLHFERDNTIILEYFGKSATRFLKKKNRLYNAESVMLKFVYKKLPKLRKDEPEMIDIFKQLKKELIEIMKDPLELKALKYFDMLSWIDSKIQKKDFAEVIKAQ